MKVTYANVMASIAVFLALGGGSFAVASHLKVRASDIQRNAVRSKHIKNQHVRSPDVARGAVKTGKLGDGAVTNGKIADLNVTGTKLGLDAVTSSRVSDNSLTGADIDESSLGQVPSVASGAIKASNFGTFTRRTGSVVVPGGVAANGHYATRTASANCATNEMAFAGHAFWTTGKDGDDELPLIETRYSTITGDRPIGFSAEGGNDTSQDTTLQAVVLCLQP